MVYKQSNVFAKILRGEIPARKVYEDEHVLAIWDANPRCKVHVLVMPKGQYTGLSNFIETASIEEQMAFWNAIDTIVRDGTVEGQGSLVDSGYRVIVNEGKDGGQEVPHLHAHILGGEPLGHMVSDPNACTI